MTDPIPPLSQVRFQGALETVFEVAPVGRPDAPIALRLVKVQVMRAPPAWEQFSVLFTGPLSPAYAQGTYRFVHPGLGELDLFMVPVGRSRDGMEYEVCISFDTRDHAPAGGALPRV